MKKKYLLVIAMIVTSLSVVACSGLNEEKTTETADTSEEKSVLAHNIEPPDPFAIPEITNPLITYNIDDYVTLGDYKNITVTLENDYSVSEQDVIDNINYMLSYQTLYEPTDKMIIEPGDIVNIDYVGKKDDVPFDRGSAQGYNLTIGSGTFVPGFEEGLVGESVGDTVDIPITFPEGYKDPALSGADVVFTVTINYIAEKVSKTYDDLTDDFVSTVLGIESVEEFKSLMRSSIESSNESSRNVEIRSKVVKYLRDSSTVTIPDGLVEQKVDEWIEMLIHRADVDDLETYVSDNYSMTMDQFRSQLTSEIEETVYQELILKKIADEMDIQVSDEDYQAYLAEMVSSSGLPEETVILNYSTTFESAEDYLKNQKRLADTLEKILESVEVKEAS